ncbi:hypothetical protein ACN2AU_04800 [Aerococcus viridans]
MSLHKTIKNKRIQNAYNDGILSVVERRLKTDEYNTPIPGSEHLKSLGTYPIRLQGIHSQDRYEFGSQNVTLERRVRMPLNLHIHSGMTAILNNDESVTYDIVKLFPDFTNKETELLLAKEGGYSDTKV